MFLKPPVSQVPMPAHPALLCLAFIAFVSPVFSDDYHTVATEPFRLQYHFAGIVEATDVVETTLEPEAWSEFIVTKLAVPGQSIKKGDVLLQIDTTKLDQEIDKRSRELIRAKHALKQAEVNLQMAESWQPHGLAQLKQTQRVAQEDLEIFTKSGREQNEKTVKSTAVNAANSLVYETEELNQLKKMYRADDLGEATEEIILKRQTNTVDYLRFKRDTEARNQELSMAYTQPRNKINLEHAVAAADYHVQKAVKQQPLDRASHQQAVARLKQDLHLNETYLAKLKRDRRLTTIKASANGMLYYGAFRDRAWQHAGTDKYLKPGATLPLRTPLLTLIPETSKYRIRGYLPEASRTAMTSNLPARIVPKAFSNLAFMGKITAISPAPVQPEWFDVTIALDAPLPKSMQAGMKVNIRTIPYAVDKALAVPTTAISYNTNLEPIVTVKTADATREQVVTLGFAYNGKTEIRSGLKVGDQVYAPKSTKK